MVERVIIVREVASSIPAISIYIFFYLFLVVPITRWCSYHPMIDLLCLVKAASFKCFVSTFARWSCVRTLWIEILLLSTYWRKWWYLINICFVRGQYLCSRAISRAPILSSNTLQWTLVSPDWTVNL